MKVLCLPCPNLWCSLQADDGRSLWSICWTMRGQPASGIWKDEQCCLQSFGLCFLKHHFCTNKKQSFFNVDYSLTNGPMCTLWALSTCPLHTREMSTYWPVLRYSLLTKSVKILIQPKAEASLFSKEQHTYQSSVWQCLQSPRESQNLGFSESKVTTGAVDYHFW